MAQRSAYGGQAVIEGVMIRGKNRVATACRRKDGSIVVRRDDADSVLLRHRWLRAAFLRGTPALIESMRLGYRMMMWSGDIAMEGEPTQKPPSPWLYNLVLVLSLALAILLFTLLPTYLVSLLPGSRGFGHQSGNLWMQLLPTRTAIFPNIVEGCIRLVLLVGYIAFVGRNPELRRVFAYHGAEHKVVNAWEGHGELSVAIAKGYSRIHPRCGTSFLFLVFVAGIVVHALIGWPSNIALRMGSRLLLLPIVAGLAYELIRLSGRYRDSRLLRLLIWPGLLLQRLTTAEPSDDQIEVAIQSMRSVLEDEGVLTAPVTPERAPLG